ncbi:MAG: MBL fold metallo-hydrolase [Candidatus Thorarchaeota archaeon]
METVLASFEIKIAFDNKKIEDRFISDFGFSVLIYNNFTENYLLFDTGSNSEALIHNIEQFDIDISDISKVIISHNHYEHIGGLDGVYDKNSNIEIYVPTENLISYRRKYPKSRVIGVSDKILIEQNIYSTGQLGNYLKEQAIFLKTEEDYLIAVVGCCHPGLDEIISMGKTIGKIKAIIGGFHGFRKFSCLEGIDFIGATHCTQHIDLLKNKFPDQYKNIYVGDSLVF